MNPLKLISAGITALKKGEILAHPEKWKNAQALSMALVGVSVPLYSAICASAEACHGITSDEVTQIATWAGGAAFAIFQIWTTLATSTKVGFGKRTAPSDAPVDPIRARPIARLREPEGPDRTEQMQPNSGGDRRRSGGDDPGSFGY
jgi:hypothetical protein